MNILNFLIKKRQMVGVEISNSNLRIAYFRPKQNKENIKTKTSSLEDELVLIEEPIPSNIISNGILLEVELLGKILDKVWKKERLSKSYAVVAIPEDKIYSQILSFPETFIDLELKEAIDIAIDFQLPVKRKDAYISSENISNSSNVKKEVLISMVSKNIVDNYIKALDYAGINILAIESHLASIIRGVDLKEKTLFIKNNKDSTTAFILKNGSLNFSRTIPSNIIEDKNIIESEINKIKSSLETEIKEDLNKLPITDCQIKDEYKKYIEKNTNISHQSEWLISIGALIRGESKEGQDNQISLLSVGTAEAYSYQKTKMFTTLIRNIIIGVSIFFLFTFIATYFFIFSISKNIKNNLQITQTASEIDNKESLIKKVNSLTRTSSSFLSTTPNWSILIEEIKSRTIDGITISNFNAPSVNDTISLVGISKDRNTLNQFKKTLQESSYITLVELPITNLEQKGDIPFSVSFKLINPSMLYYK